MARLLGMVLIAASVLGTTARVAEAGYCGAARYHCLKRACCSPAICGGCQQCYTVMKTCRETVYETQQITCFKTYFQSVCETRMVTCTRYIPETRFQQCTYTAWKPVYETAVRTVVSTVCRPVWETQTRQICHTVCRPVYETCQREVRHTVCRPVKCFQTVRVCSGHWETQVAETAVPPCAPAACAPATCAPAPAPQSVPVAAFGCLRSSRSRWNASSTFPRSV